MSQQNSGQQVYFGVPPGPTLGLVLNIYERQLFFFSTFVRTVIVGKWPNKQNEYTYKMSFMSETNTAQGSYIHSCAFWWIYNMLVSHLPRFYAGKARPKEGERQVLPRTSVRGGVINLGLARRATSNVTAIHRAVYAGQC